MAVSIGYEDQVSDLCMIYYCIYYDILLRYHSNCNQYKLPRNLVNITDSDDPRDNPMIQIFKSIE